MMDPTLLRFQQMFGAMQGTAPQQSVMPERLGTTEPMGIQAQVIDPSQIGSESIPQSPEQNIAQRLQQLYSPETTANDRLSQLLSQYPQRENPGVLAKIVGSLIGGARGPDAADRAMYGGYYRDVQDWENQVKPASHLANQERYNNQNERQFANQVVTQELNERKFGHKQETDEANIKIREKRASAYDFKQRNPNLTIKIDAQGNFIGINPQTGQKQYITGPDGKPVNSGDMSDYDKINLMQQNALERIDATADAGLTAIGARGVVQGQLIDKRDEIHDENVEEGTDKPLSPSAERTAKLARAEDFTSKHPELADWIVLDGNKVTVREGSSGGWFGKADSPALRKAIVDHVVDGKPFIAPIEAKPENKISPANGKLPEGKIKVRAPNNPDGTPGVVGMIPMSRLDAYLKGGYKKVN